jgi:Ca2+-binding RTX toxin-like protein
MTLFIGTSGTASFAVSGEIVVLAYATLTNDNASIIYETGDSFTTWLTVDGKLYSGFGFTAIRFFSESEAIGDLVFIGTTGRVVGAPSGDAIYLSGAGQRLINNGEVSGAVAVSLQSGLFSSLENNGALYGFEEAVSINDTASAQIVNSGLISGDVAINYDDSYGQVYNRGEILGGGGTAIRLNTTLGGLTLRNHGLVEGTAYAVQVVSGYASILNQDRLVGTVWLGDENDFLAGRSGIIDGDVYAGGGNDTLRTGTADDVVYGGSGRDHLRGNDGDDVLRGEAGNDTLRGDAGDDTFFGGSNSDRFIFTRGDDDDILRDFENGVDKLDLSAFRAGGFSGVAALASNVSGGLLLNLRSLGGGTVYLEGFFKASFDASDALL